MQLQLQTWQEVDAYLQSSRGIILPIGSTEQHGPIGLIGTDAICAEVIARGVGEATGALVAPTIAVGMAQHHMAFAGSMTLRPSTLIAVLQDTVESLVKHGFERFYFLNGHGGNIATLAAAFSEIYASRSLSIAAAGSPIKCRLKNWWQNQETYALAKELYGDAEGSHATPSEVAVTHRLSGESIRSPTAGGLGDRRRRRLPPQFRRSHRSNPGLATPKRAGAMTPQSARDIQHHSSWVMG
jgi:creatinine amidohydrolase